MNPSEFHSARKFTTAFRARVAYLERGSGPDAALLLHGFPLCSYQWRDLIDDLAPMRRCIAPDLVGLGYSEPAADADVSFVAQAQTLAHLLDALKIDKVDIVANDTGGGISQVFAASYPERVRTLTLTNCEVHDLWPTAMLEPFFEALRTGEAGQSLAALATAVATARQLFAPTYENPSILDAETCGVYFQPIADSPVRRECLRGFGEARENRDQMVALAPRLRTVKSPAQVIWGEADTAFDTSRSLAWLSENLGGVRRIVRVPRAKLFFPEEHPRLLATMVREFWEKK
jgi:haloalkane dehalogenase